MTLRAKDLATAMTSENVRRKNLSGKAPILDEHTSSNKSVQGALTNSGIYPEQLPPVEDIKKIEMRHRKEKKGVSEAVTRIGIKAEKRIGRRNEAIEIR